MKRSIETHPTKTKKQAIGDEGNISFKPSIKEKSALSLKFRFLESVLDKCKPKLRFFKNKVKRDLLLAIREVFGIIGKSITENLNFGNTKNITYFNAAIHHY